MTKVRRGAAIALCAGLSVGLAAHLSGDVGPRQSSASELRATDRGQPGMDAANHAGPSVPTRSEQAARMAAAQDLLSSRAGAVKTRNKGAWMATVDSPGSAFGRRQSVAFDNLIRLPLGGFSYGPVSYGTVAYGTMSYGRSQKRPVLTPARARQVGPNAWVAKVAGSYSLVGFDRSPRAFEASYTLVRRSGGWRIAGDSDGTTALQLWDLPGLKVLRGRSGIVIGNAPAERMHDYRTITDAAVRRVSGVWGTCWSSHVVVLTPSTAKEFAGLLSGSAGQDLDQVAAVAQGVTVPGRRAQGDQIVINPKAFTALRPDGRRVVVTHELTHVAARSSTTRPVPVWLSEGLAEYVGYSGLNLPRERVASGLLGLVRAGRGPQGLPTAADFDQSQTRIAPFYSASWLAVSRLVDLYGQARVLAFYRTVAGGPAAGGAAAPDPDARAAAAFTHSFGVTKAQFVDGWQHYLRTLAHSRG